jgi:protein SCO1/2
VYGSKTVAPNGDSIDYTLPHFSYLDQDRNTVAASVIHNKIFVTEFFFTSCPSICPKMQQQMLRFYEKYKNNPDVIILAFTIDPERDSVGKLNAYAHKLNIESSKWHLLTGNKDSIYALAENFLVSAAEDADAPGGHIHSGNFVLVDTKQRLRGYYDGTIEESVTKLLNETDLLLQEK